MESTKWLILKILKVEFAKSCHYFVRVQKDTDKNANRQDRTEVCMPSRRPKFCQNRFNLGCLTDCKGHRVLLGVYVIQPPSKDEDQGLFAAPRFLGSCSLSIDEYEDQQLINGTDVSCDFVRKKQGTGNDMVVGKAFVQLMLSDSKEIASKPLGIPPCVSVTWRHLSCQDAILADGANLVLRTTVRGNGGLEVVSRSPAVTFKQPSIDVNHHFTVAVGDVEISDVEIALCQKYEEQGKSGEFEAASFVLPIGDLMFWKHYHMLVDLTEDITIGFSLCAQEEKAELNFAAECLQIEVQNSRPEIGQLTMVMETTDDSNAEVQPKEFSHAVDILRLPNVAGRPNVSAVVDEDGYSSNACYQVCTSTNKDGKIIWADVPFVLPIFWQQSQVTALVVRFYTLKEDQLHPWGHSVLEIPETFKEMKQPSTLYLPISLLHPLAISEENPVVSVTWKSLCSLDAIPILAPQESLAALEKLWGNNVTGEQLVAQTTWEERRNSMQDTGRTDVKTTEPPETDNPLATENKPKDQQVIIEKLVKEVERRTKAIQKCGSEIVKLRHQLQAVEEENQQLSQKLIHIQEEGKKDFEDFFQVLTGTESWSESIPDSICRKMRAVAKAYHEQAAENRKLNERVQILEKVHTKAKSREEEFKKLKKGQLVQAAYLQKIQSTIGKMEAYKKTIQTQEKVIEKLEKLMQKKLKEHRNTTQQPSSMNAQRDQPHGFSSGPTTSPETNKTPSPEDSSNSSDEQKQTEDQGTSSSLQNQSKEKELDELRAQLKLLKEEKTELTVLLKFKDSKIKIIQDQMIANAKASANTISDLKMKVFELEMGEDANSDFGDDFSSTNIDSHEDSLNMHFEDVSENEQDETALTYIDSGKGLLQSNTSQDDKLFSTTQSSRRKSRTSSSRLESLVRPLSGDQYSPPII